MTDAELRAKARAARISAEHSTETENALGWIVLTMLLILPFAAWYGFVIKTLWHWFIVPLSVRPVGLWEAAGIYLLVRLLTFQVEGTDEDKTAAEIFARSIIWGILAPALALGFAAIYHGFAS